MPGEKRTASLVRADRETTLTLITTLYDHGEQKSISEFTCRTLLMKYNSTIRSRSFTAKYRNLRLTTEMFKEKKKKDQAILCVCVHFHLHLYTTDICKYWMHLGSCVRVCRWVSSRHYRGKFLGVGQVM